jgi:hypothetical protein
MNLKIVYLKKANKFFLKNSHLLSEDATDVGLPHLYPIFTPSLPHLYPIFTPLLSGVNCILIRSGSG